LVSEPSPGGPRTRARHARRQAHIAENSGDADEGLTDDDDMEEPGAAEHGPTGPEIIGRSKTNSLNNFDRIGLVDAGNKSISAVNPLRNPFNATDPVFSDRS
jgi:hypothetical protein